MLNLKSGLLLLAVGSISACGGGSVTNTTTGETAQCDVSQGFVQCGDTQINTSDISLVATNDDGTYTIEHEGQEYIFTPVDEIPENRKGILSEELLGVDINGDGDMNDTIDHSTDGEGFDFRDYDLADEAIWSNWSVGTPISGATQVTPGDWSSWTATATAAWNVPTVLETRSRSVVTTVGATVGYDSRTCSVTVNGQIDNPAPTCNGDATRTVTYVNGTSTTSTETEVRTVANPNYELNEGVADQNRTHLKDDLRNLLTDAGVSVTEEVLENTLAGFYSYLNVRGLDEAHADGWTGLGHLITIVDAGWDHAETVTSIASIVAPGAELNTHVFSDSHFTNAATISRDTYTVGSNTEIVYGRADVINLSIGVNHWARSESDIVTSSYNLLSDIYYAGTTGDTVFTISAGNDGLSNIFTEGSIADGVLTYSDVANGDISVLAPLINSEFADKTIVVGALDGDEIAWYSNEAGTAMDYTLFAEGDNPLDNDPSNVGTSYAAPRVAGAAALVRHKFPGLSAENTVNVLLDTAFDAGAPGTDTVYGRGILDVGAALSPVGTVY